MDFFKKFCFYIPIIVLTGLLFIFSITPSFLNFVNEYAFLKAILVLRTTCVVIILLIPAFLGIRSLKKNRITKQCKKKVAVSFSMILCSSLSLWLFSDAMALMYRIVKNQSDQSILFMKSITAIMSPDHKDVSLFEYEQAIQEAKELNKECKKKQRRLSIVMPLVNFCIGAPIF